jgi:hypothetical protein
MTKAKKKAAKKAQKVKSKAAPKKALKKSVKKSAKKMTKKSSKSSKTSAVKQTTEKVLVSSDGMGGEGYPESDSHEDANDVGGLASYDEIDPGFGG